MGLNLSGMTTETRNPRTMQLDQMSPLEIVTVMNEEDARVPLAIAKCLPQIAQAVTWAACTDLIAAPHKVICRVAVHKGCGPFCGFAANKSRNNKVKDKINITSYNPCGCVFFSLDSAPQNWYAFQVCHVYCT